ncbi:MAG: DUF421 domain-containing protein [Bacilli bacterium]|nr:DUF421 domain-containing protein [Bacilli bacterium]MDD4718370.1 DUF421 domain-containing protein [Bacilli bacterium]
MLNDIFVIKWIELLDVFIRAILSLITLFLITKMLGTKQVSQLSLFDYVIGISIGNFAAEMTINLESQYINGITAVVVFGAIAYFVSFLTMKSIRLRRFFMGTPTIVIQQGKLLEKNLKKMKLDVNDLLEECRCNGYFNIEEIEFAIMEVNGNLSILPKGKYKPIVIGDMSLPIPKQGLCANIIIDGKVMTNNLKLTLKDESWLLNEINKQGHDNYSKILLATLDINNNLVIYERNLHEVPKNFLE